MRNRPPLPTTRTLTSPARSAGDLPGAVARHHRTGSCLEWIVVLVLCALAASAWAQQTVNLNRVHPVRVTVPVNSTVSTPVAVNVVIEDGSAPVNLSISGLPVGATASFAPASFTTNGASTLTLNTANVAEGEYTLAINATGGAVNTFLLTLQVANLWSGASLTSSNWSDAANWAGNTLPGTANDVVFTDTGGRDSLVTNCIIDADVTITSLRFSQSNSATRYHTLFVNPGKTLSLTGDKGFSLLRDFTDVTAEMNVTFAGDQGTVFVNNENANVALLVDNQQTHTLNMAELGSFVTDVNRVALGDYSLFPNFWNLQANGYNGIPRRFAPTVYLARTNLITASYVDPNNYTNGNARDYALSFVNSVTSGTTSIRDLWLGITNVFLLDGVCFVHANQQGRVRFNTAFAATNPVAYFRSPTGGRMSMFAVSDDGSTNGGVTNVKGWVDLASNNGRVDILTDRFYISRDRELIANNQTPNVQGQMFIAQGIIDANHAILGYQEYGGHTNTVEFRGYCQGQLVVSNTAVFKVNDTLELGYSTETNPLGQPQNTRGFLDVGPGGTVMVNRVLVGGPAKLSGGDSTGNRINLNNGAQLIVSNTVAGPDAKLTHLVINNASLTLHVDGVRTEPYVYTTNLVAGATGNSITLASILGYSTYPAQIPLIAYHTASANFSLKLPQGFYGYLLDNAANKTIDAIITTNPPPQVVWQGTVSGNWDTTSANWKDGLKFLDGAPVTFDDTASGATTVNVVGTVAPGEVLVTNSAKTYTFSGGTLAGTSLMRKEGTGSLVMNAPSQLPVALNAGTVTGSGTLGTTTVAPGATLNFAGTINGLLSSGTATSSGTIDNGVAIQAGVFLGAGIINGPVTISGGSAVLAATAIANATGTSTVESNATLVLDGRFNNTTARLNVNGTLTGTGIVSDPDGYTLGADGRLAINNGGILSPGHSLGVFFMEGRFDLNPGARLVIEVDMNNPARNDILAVDAFGNIRGIIVMTNIGSAPFALGQSFLIVSNNFNVANTPLNPNIDFRFEPASPGLGWVWDGSDLATNGIVKISAVATTPTTLTSVVSTNQITFSWPESHRGWVLQEQVSYLTNGISAFATNWTVVPNSQSTNSVIVNINEDREAVFYRLAHP